MLGAIIGDIAGSYEEVKEIEAKKNTLEKKRSFEERTRILDKNIPLFKDNQSYTDDTVLTLAIADALLRRGDYGEYLRKYGQKEIAMGLDQYGRSRFGKGFVMWLENHEQGNSYGNGCAMRISPVGLYCDTLEKVKEESYYATIPSHNHPDSLRMTEIVAVSIYLLKNGIEKRRLASYLEREYGLSFPYSLDSLAHHYIFTSKAIDSVPQAIYCFLCAENFEETIRFALSIGGDSDTIACIAGSLAEAHYGIDIRWRKRIDPYLLEEHKHLIDEFYEKCPKTLRKTP